MKIQSSNEGKDFKKADPYSEQHAINKGDSVPHG